MIPFPPKEHTDEKTHRRLLADAINWVLQWFTGTGTATNNQYMGSDGNGGVEFRQVDWSDLSDTGGTKPADSATAGAIWGVNITSQPTDAQLLNSQQTYGEVSGTPTTLSDVNTTEGSKLSGIQDGATVGATWDSNISSQPSNTNIYNGDAVPGLSTLLPNWNLSIVDSDGNPAGLYPVEGISDFSGISSGVDGDDTYVRLSHASDATIAYGFPAIEIDDTATYKVSIRHRASSSPNGLYLRFNERNDTLSGVYTHVGSLQGKSVSRTSLKDVVSSGAFPGSTWQLDEYTYTPTAGTKTASFSFYNWAATTVNYDIERVMITRLPGEAQKNTNVSINPDGTLTGAGGGQVTLSGLGYNGDLNATQNTISYSGTEPLSPINGDIWVDTSTSPDTTKVRVGGVWQVGATLGAAWNSNIIGQPNDTDIANTQITVSADGTLNNAGGGQVTIGGLGFTGDLAATKNSVTYSASAPVSPTDGDIWVDTSTSPDTIKVRVSGAWQNGGNFTTNTSELTDGAGLGNTAVWSSVSGTGKPADNATVGAQAGTNLKNNSGTVVDDPDLLNSYNVQSTSETFQVGASGDYSTISSALADVAKKRPTFNSNAYRVTIELQLGFIISEQIIIDGIDLSWVTITSIATTVSVSLAQASYSTVTIRSGGGDLVLRPVFCAKNGGRSPDIQLNLDGSATSVSNQVFFMATGVGSSVYSNMAISVDTASSVPNWVAHSSNNAQISFPGGISADAADIVMETCSGGQIDCKSITTTSIGTYNLNSTFSGKITISETSSIQSGSSDIAILATNNGEITINAISVAGISGTGPISIAEATYGAKITIGSVTSSVSTTGSDFSVLVGGTIVCGSFPTTPTANISLNTQTSSGIVISV